MSHSPRSSSSLSQGLRLGLALAAVAAAVVAAAPTADTLAAPSPRPQTPGAPPAPYLDPDLSFEERARDLVSRMTIEEKISQLINEAAAIPRLGVPEYNWWNECLHGVARAGVATVFPQAIGMAASFDDGPDARGGDARSPTRPAPSTTSSCAQGQRGIYQGLTFWSPNINIFRDPRWGRGQETYGEDPYLTARMGVAFVKGLQGDDPRYLQDGGDGQALRRAQRARSRPPPLRRAADRARPARDLPARVPRPAWRRPARVGDGRLQPRQRRVGLAPARACSATSCAGSGASTATWSRTAARSTTSTGATSWSRRPRRPRRSA